MSKKYYLLVIFLLSSLNIHGVNSWQNLVWSGFSTGTKFLLSFADIDSDDERDDETNKSAHLMRACFKGYKGLVEHLLQNKKNIDINSIDDDKGWTSLMWSCDKGYTEMVALLLNHGADPNIQAQERKTTALMIACYGGYKDIVKLLLNYNSAVNAKDEYGETALEVACRRGHPEVIKLLLKYGADFNSSSSFLLNNIDLKNIITVLNQLKENNLEIVFQQYPEYRDLFVKRCIATKSKDILTKISLLYPEAFKPVLNNNYFRNLLLELNLTQSTLNGSLALYKKALYDCLEKGIVNELDSNLEHAKNVLELAYAFNSYQDLEIENAYQQFLKYN